MGRTLTSKERVLAAVHHQEPDRVPINYNANPGIDRRLKEHFGLAADDGEGLRRALHVDFRSVGASYVGPRLHADLPERQVNPMWGIRTRWIEHDTGGYWDYCDFPLRDATPEQVRAWPMPSPDDFDYSAVRSQCEKHGEYCVVLGGAGVGDIINSTGMIFTMEAALIGLATDDPAVLTYVDRKTEIMTEVLARTFEAAAGLVDIMWMGEDLGTQIAPLIGLELYRRHIRPRQQRYVDIARANNVPVIIHTCGSSSWAYEDFIAIGIRGVDTLQPEARNMSPRYLKATFGGRLAFHGCISTAGPAAAGTVEQTVRDVAQTLETMMPGGGYMLSPTHQWQDNSPTENILAVYETALERGRY